MGLKHLLNRRGDRILSILDEISFENEYVGRITKDNNWHADQWDCVIEYNGSRFSFPFYMGIGLNGKDPEKIDVLDSLLNDAKAGEMSFDEFCSEFGYDNDSIKHLKIHKECQKITDNIYNLFSENEFDELQDEIYDLMQNA
jgi:hypothetical protein